MKLTTQEKAALHAAIGFIRHESQAVADWLFSGLEAGEPLPDDIKHLEAATQYMRSYGVKHGPYPVGSNSMARKITAMIKASDQEPNPFAPINVGGPSIKSIKTSYREST